MDKRLSDAAAPGDAFVRRHGLDYYVSGENHDYLADEVLRLTPEEAQSLLRAGDDCFDLLRTTARRCLGDPTRLRQLGIPDRAVAHLRWSVEEEWDDFVVGRFDFAGGVEGLPLKLIEFNADTCSLLPETLLLQPEILKRSRVRPLTNDLQTTLRATLRRIGKARGGTVGLGAHIGGPDDQLNLEVLLDAARAAGWKKVDATTLEQVIFDPEFGMLLDLGTGEPLRYPYLFKFFPWDWAVHEEPELWDLLTEMSRERLLRVLNPAWTMLLQSKALLTFAYQDNPGHPLLLPTAFDPAQLFDPRRGYVRKPVLGRMGENIMVSLDGRRGDAETQGDYGDQAVIYQERAAFGRDADGAAYQLSVFQAPTACAICCRREEGLILGDDAEFVAVGRL